MRRLAIPVAERSEDSEALADRFLGSLSSEEGRVIQRQPAGGAYFKNQAPRDRDALAVAAEELHAAVADDTSPLRAAGPSMKSLARDRRCGPHVGVGKAFRRRRRMFSLIERWKNRKTSCGTEPR